MAQALTEAAYRLGKRDARLGHAEGHPIHPFSSEELEAYRAGYHAWKKTDRMADAHRDGMRRASEVFAIACDTAMRDYPNDHEAQFAYLAGLVQELRRIATRTQNKGFRR